jgi:hypothetical protein
MVKVLIIGKMEISRKEITRMVKCMGMLYYIRRMEGSIK